LTQEAKQGQGVKDQGHKTAGSKLALFVDFDGTVTEQDVGGMLLEAFGAEDGGATRICLKLAPSMDSSATSVSCLAFPTGRRS
jgi:hypothetical protein